MLVLILLASLGMPIGAQNIDNKGRVSGDSVTVDVGANRVFSRHESTPRLLPATARFYGRRRAAG